MASERVTVTIPEKKLEEIDLRARTRSRYVQRSIGHELERLRQEELLQSLDSPHPDSQEVAESGFYEWAGQAHDGDDELAATSAGTAIRWDEKDGGWVEEDR